MASFQGSTTSFGRRWFLFLLAALMMAGTFAAGPARVSAQDAEVPAEEKKEEAAAAPAEAANPITHFLSSIGLVFGAIFLLVSIGMIALIIVLVMDLRMGDAVNTAFVDDFTGLVNKRQFKQAYELCRNDSSYLARVMTSGMSRLQYGIEDARESMLSMVETIRSQKENLIAYLATIGTLGPLLGLVGTVSGMIGAFRKLGETKDKAPNASDLAGEISHALVVTLVGVAIAVPAIFFFTFFKNRLTSIAMNTTNLADDLLTQMFHNSKRPAPGGATAGPDRASTSVQAAGGGG